MIQRTFRKHKQVYLYLFIHSFIYPHARRSVLSSTICQQRSYITQFYVHGKHRQKESKTIISRSQCIVLVLKFYFTFNRKEIIAQIERLKCAHHSRPGIRQNAIGLTHQFKDKGRIPTGEDKFVMLDKKNSYRYPKKNSGQ